MEADRSRPRSRSSAGWHDTEAQDPGGPCATHTGSPSRARCPKRFSWPDGPGAARTTKVAGVKISFGPRSGSPASSVKFTVVTDDEAMGIALEEAARAIPHNDVPVGAVVLGQDGTTLARSHNERERTGDPTAHAEVLALRSAAARLGTWRLTNTTLFVTLEPCPMCAGALVAARVGRVVFASADPKAGAAGTLYNLCADPRLNHEVAVTRGVRADEASALLTAFFASRRGASS